MINEVKNTLNNLDMDLMGRHEEKGIIFEIYMLKNGCLECYSFPKHEEWKKKLFAHSTCAVDYMDMLLYCIYNYEF